MKKILVESVIEECEYFCDKHPDKEAFSQLNITSWYGSEYDLMGVEVHLCDECVKKMYEYINNEYNLTPKDIEL